MTPTRRLPILLVALLASLPVAPAAIPAAPPPVVLLELQPAPGAGQATHVAEPLRIPLILQARTSASGPPPGEVTFAGTDDHGGNVTFQPPAVQLHPLRETYHLNVTYLPTLPGGRALQITARGPLGSRAHLGWNVTVAPDPVKVAITHVADEADARWRVPGALQAATTRLPEASANLTLRLRYADADPSPTWTQPLGAHRLTSRGTDVAFDLLARHGAGRYQVVVHAEGPRTRGATSPVLVDVAPPGPGESSAPVTAVVPDHPTHLALTRDSVNADGKSKYPGQDLITRLVLQDENGLGHVPEVTLTYRRVPDAGPPVVVARQRIPLPPDAWHLTDVPLEDRFNVTPLKDGPHDVLVEAPGSDAPPVSRTFRVRDVLPTLLGGAVAEEGAIAGPDPLELPGWVRVADRNLGSGPLGPPVGELGTVTAILYRGPVRLGPPHSVDLDGAGDRLDLRNATTDDPRYEVVADAGALRVPVTLRFPGGADPGHYRVTLHHEADGTTRRLGTVRFDLREPPTVEAVHLDPPHPKAGEVLRVASDLSSPGDSVGIQVRLLQTGPGSDQSLAEARTEGTTLHLEVPDPLPVDRPTWLEVTPLLPLGRRGPATVVPMEPATTPPALTASLLVDGHPHPGTPLRLVPGTVAELAVEVHARGHHGSAPRVSFVLQDWNGDLVGDGSCEARRSNATANATCHLPLPPDLPSGRYALRVEASGPGGSTAWERPLDAGAWTEARLDGPLHLRPSPEGHLEGRVLLRNAGNVPLPQVTLRIDPFRGPDGTTWTPEDAEVELHVDARTHAPEPIQPGTWRFAATPPLLDPGEDAFVHLRVPIPVGPPPGTYEARLHLTVPAPEGPP